MSSILYLATAAVSMLFAALFLPVLIAVTSGEGEGTRNLVILAVLGTFLSLLLVAAVSGRVKAPNRAQSLLAVAVVWVICPLVGALPFVVTSSTPFVAALFESVSGLTTTGATTFGEGRTLSTALLVWRTELEWLGGYLTLACVIHVLAPAGIGGLPRSDGRFFRGEHDPTRSVEIDRFLRLFLQYLVITLVVAVLFLMAGMKGLGALLLAMTAIATGGFFPGGAEQLQNAGEAARLLLALVLALSATSLFWQRLVQGDIREIVRRNREAQWIFGLIALLGLVYAARLFVAADLPPLTALNEGLLAASSIISTSGIEARPRTFVLLPELLVLFVALAGASVFSTAGGIKLYRIGGMILQASHELALLVYPSSVQSTDASGASSSGGSPLAVWSVFISAIFVIALGAFLLSLQAGFEAALALAISAFANAGPIYLSLVPAGYDPALWPGFDAFEPFTMGVTMAVMLLGRLEVLAVFAALNLKYWINR
jgi:trk system potassium uptake protein TrkH